MTATDSLPESEAVPDRAVVCTRSGSSWTPGTDMLPWRGTAAGGGYSTVGDLERFANALSSGTLLTEAMLSEATREQATSYGYGFAVEDEPATIYGHGGVAPGMNGPPPESPRARLRRGGAQQPRTPAAADALVNFFTTYMPDLQP